MDKKSKYTKYHKPQDGFTLIELLVVIAIIALLLAISMPALIKGKEQSRRVVCASNLHQLGVAVNCYQTDYKGNIPYMHYPNYIYAGPIVAREDWKGCGYYIQSIGVSLWPYVENKMSFYCPNNYKSWSINWNDNPSNPNSSNRNIGYMYFGNIPSEVYPKFKDCPRGRNIKSNQLLIQDMVVWVRSVDYYGYTAHTSTKVDGGNGLFSGGHVNWFPIATMSKDWIDPCGYDLLWYKWFLTKP